MKNPGLAPVPGLDPLLLERVRDLLHQPGGDERLVAPLAVEDRDRHAPGPLAREAPVGPVLDHVVDAVAPPVRDPADPVDLPERGRPQAALVEREEPLVGRAEDHRVVAAPAVRVAVLQLRGRIGEQVSRGVEVLHDLRVRREDLLARVLPRLGGEAPGAVHRVQDLEPVAQADLVVLLAVPGGGVDEAGAGLERHVLAEDDRGLAVHERVAVADALERLALEVGEDALRAGEVRRGDRPAAAGRGLVRGRRVRRGDVGARELVRRDLGEEPGEEVLRDDDHLPRRS